MNLQSFYDLRTNPGHLTTHEKNDLNMCITLIEGGAKVSTFKVEYDWLVKQSQTPTKRDPNAWPFAPALNAKMMATLREAL